MYGYLPVELKNVNVFKFPENGKEYNPESKTDVHNLQHFKRNYIVYKVIEELEELLSNNPNEVYIFELINEYNSVCISLLSLISEMCWKRIDPEDESKGYMLFHSFGEIISNLRNEINTSLRIIEIKMRTKLPYKLYSKVPSFERF